MDYPQYDPQSDNSPLSDQELQALDEWLHALPSEAAMNIEGMDGYLTALLVGPAQLAQRPSAQWLPAVWGGDGPGGAPFASNKQRKRVTVWVLRHLQSIACQLRDRPDDWQPIFSVAESGDDEWVDAEDWCIGYLQGVALDADAWAPLFDDPTLAAALAPIVILGADEANLQPAELALLADQHARDELSRAVADAVLLLHTHRQAAAE